MNSNYKDGQGIKHDYGCQCEALKSQLSQVQGEKEFYKNQCASWSGKYQVLEDERDALKAENERLKMEGGISLGFMREAFDQRDSLQKEVQKITKDRDRWADWYDDLLKRTKDLAKEVERLRGALEKIANQPWDSVDDDSIKWAREALSSNEGE